MESKFLEARVGALLLAAVAGTALLTFLLGDCGHRAGGSIDVDMAYTGGVPEGAPVRMAGVKVGRVRGVELLPTRRDDRGDPLPVRFHLQIDRSVRAAVTIDSQVWVATQGALGEPFLEIEPGTPGSKPLAEGQALRGNDPGRTDLLMSRFAHLLDQVGAALPRDPKAIADLLGTLTTLARNADAVLAENRAVLARAAQDLGAAAEDARVVAARARGALGDGKEGALADAAEAARALPGLVEKADASLSAVQRATAGITAEDGARVRDAIARYAAAGKSVESIAQRADTLLARMEAQGWFDKPGAETKSCKELEGLVSELKHSMVKMVIKY